MNSVFTDRSRTETYQRCHRARWLEYHEAGTGITGATKPLPLAVGAAVHAGLAGLLMGQDEDAAVALALADLGKFAGGKLDVDLLERAGQVVDSLAADPDLQVLAIETAARARSGFDQYLFEEQCALVEGMVRAYARRRLRPLLEQFEVLEVEREGQWTLSEQPHHIHDIDGVQKCVWCGFVPKCNADFDAICWELTFMSRPDALLLDRQTRDLHVLSFKTAASWDVRKARDAERDMQGLSEGVEIEKRLGEWWDLFHTPEQEKWNLHSYDSLKVAAHESKAMVDYLRSCASPPRIHAVRYEYMLKGDRRVDKDLSAELQMEARSQASVLVRGYLSPGMTVDDAQWNCQWEYVKDTGEAGKLAWQRWKAAPVWRTMTERAWIDLLDTAVETVDEGQAKGWSCKAQATGYLAQHPLDSVFIPPVTVYRNEDDLRDMVEQLEAQEVRVAEDVARVRGAGDEGEKRHLLNVLFQQSRRACEYPSTCQFVPVCYGGEDMRRDPLGSGRYVARVPNHPQENAGTTKIGT